MTVAGIVAEYNPFHTGHAYQIAQTRARLEGDAAVVAVMSGNWVQQADCAVADKWIRARMAVLGGVDLVLELPTVWATASAETFARGAVSLLEAAGVVDVLSFGSECGAVEQLEQVADCLEEADFRAALRRFLEKGMSFAASRQAAVGALLGEEVAARLSGPNNNLGVEYIRALRLLKSAIRPITVRREGAAHGSMYGEDTEVQFHSATQIRSCLEHGEWERIYPYLPEACLEVLREEWEGMPSLSHLERTMLARVRIMTEAEWSVLPDSGAEEGLPQRLVRAGKQARSMEEFYTLAKTRRYTHARLRRLVLRAYLGIRSEAWPKDPPYLRVLGFNGRGQQLLKEMKERAALPVLTKPAHAHRLDATGRKLFEQEAQYTDLYDLCLERIPVPGREWTTGPVLLRGEGTQE